jgi:hypothetical protein
MSAMSRRAFDHVLVLMFENQYRGYVVQNPYLRRLARQGIELRSSFGVMHPSQTNYIASIAGELCNVTSDDPIAPLLAQRTIVDLLEDAGLGWKAYMQGYCAEAQPWSPALVPADQHPYYVKHNPFGSFAKIVQREDRWRRVQDEAAFFADVLDGALPEYAWFTPNIWNDGHYVNGTSEDCNPRAPALVDQLATWLEGFFGRLRFPGPRSRLPPRTLVVVTFDEADFEADWEVGNASAYDGPNQIYTVLLGDMIRPGVEEEEGYNHYSLLRTIEENFGLGTLGKNDAGANWMQFLWGRRFRWGAPQRTPFAAGGALAVADCGGALHIVYAASEGGLVLRSYAAGGWSEERPLGVKGDGVALASYRGGLLLVIRDAEGVLRSLQYHLTTGWSALDAEPIATGAQGGFALAGLDGDERAMLVWRDRTGALQSRARRGGAWQAAVPVGGFTADAGAPVTLSSLGPTLYLIFKAPGADTMSVVSCNTAPFNVVSVPANKYGGAQDDTTVDAWSPSAFPVAHFSARPDAATRNELEPVTRAFRAGGALAAATLDGVLHLAHPTPDHPLVLSATLSIAGLMTPAKPVSYKSADQATVSDGFGTLAEAGWSTQVPVHGALVAPGGALAMSRTGGPGALALLFQPQQGGDVWLCMGAYSEAD